VVRDPGRDALAAWAIALVLVLGFVHINVTLPAIGDVGSALIAVLFLYGPMAVARVRREDLDDYGFHKEPLARGLITAGATIAVIFPIFCVGYFLFYETACGSTLLAHLVPNGMCGSFAGLSGVHWPTLSLGLGEFCAVQLLVVALPEELFFRGCLLRLLEQKFPPKRRILGGGVGWALVISAAMFALIHLPKDGDPRALATFFPGLLFGWMRSATGSILASTVTHGCSNILIKLLDLSVLR
jgi:membrane protease YdiL (CAAX protease family)